MMTLKLCQQNPFLFTYVHCYLESGLKLCLIFRYVLILIKYYIFKFKFIFAEKSNIIGIKQKAFFLHYICTNRNFGTWPMRVSIVVLRSGIRMMRGYTSYGFRKLYQTGFIFFSIIKYFNIFKVFLNSNVKSQTVNRIL